MLAKEVKRRAAHEPLKRKTKVHKSPATMVPLGIGVQVTRAFLYQMPPPRYQWFTVGTPQFVHHGAIPYTLYSFTPVFYKRQRAHMAVQHSTRHTHTTHHEGFIFQHLATKVYTILLLCQLVQCFIAQAPAKRLSNGIHQTVTEKDRERNKPTVLGATIPAGQSGGCYYRGGATVKCWIRSAPVTFRRPSRDVRDEGELVRPGVPLLYATVV